MVYIETHAGAGRYDLCSGQALKTAEFRQGIARLWGSPGGHRAPWLDGVAELAPYLGVIEALNPDGTLSHYPGSPALAAQLLRPVDRLVLMERHPTEAQALRRHLGGDPRIGIHQRDGLEGLIGLVPPKPARGLVLIDPAYEQTAEYTQVADALVAAHKRWPTGVYALWFPRLARQRDRSEDLLKRIGKAIPEGLLCSLDVRAQADGLGMHGSGMLLLNPPWRIEEQLTGLLARLADALAIDLRGSRSAAWSVSRLNPADNRTVGR